MKTLKLCLAMLLLVVGVSSCKKVEGPKGDKGDKGEQGVPGQNGPDAKTFNFNLTFTTSDTFKPYSGITGYDSGDVIITYVLYEVLGGTSYWVQTPIILNNAVNVFAEFSDQTGNLFVNTLKANGTSGSPWTSSQTLAFKAVLIKSTGIKKNPNLDYSNYEDVKEAFNL